MADIQSVAQAYLDEGYAVVPLVKGEKRASTSWQKRTYKAYDFNAGDGIAIKCGEPSRWLVDVDCDAIEAVEAAKLLLPQTGLIHGRPGKPDSHYWFICEGIKTAQFSDVNKGGMLIEIRSTGGYTAVPPSGHPSGDTLAWVIQRAAMKIAADALYDVVRDIAICAILVRHWPGSGQTHTAIGPLAGFLVAGGLAPDAVQRVIVAAATIAKSDVRDVTNFVTATLAKYANGEKVTGGPTLAQALGDDVVTRMRAWLKLADVDAIEDMNTRHFWVRMGKDDVIGREDTANGAVVFQRPKALYSEYADRHVTVGEKKNGDPIIKPLVTAWLESPMRRRYREVVFAPPKVQADERDYNLWRGFAVEPVPGDCSLFLSHIRDVICSGNQQWYDYLLDLTAITIQEPGEPSGVAVALRGEPGTGKGFFVRALLKLFGTHGIQLDNTKHLVGGFNAAISGKVIVFADEAFWAGDKRIQGSLKRLITEPTLTIERKGIDAIQERNCIHLFIATNEDRSYPAMFKERRLFALHVSDCRLDDHAYFAALQHELDNGGLAAFLDLMQRRVVDRLAVRKPPVTPELLNQQEENLNTEMQFMLELLIAGEYGDFKWPNVVGEKDGRWVKAPKLYEAYRVYESSQYALSAQTFAKRVGDIISAEKPRSHSFKDKTNVRGWNTRTLTDARKAFDAKRFSQSDLQSNWPDLTPEQGRLP